MQPLLLGRFSRVRWISGAAIVGAGFLLRFMLPVVLPATVVEFDIESGSVTATAMDHTREMGSVVAGSGRELGTISEDDLQRWHALALTLVSADAVGAPCQ